MDWTELLNLAASAGLGRTQIKIERTADIIKNFTLQNNHTNEY